MPVYHPDWEDAFETFIEGLDNNANILESHLSDNAPHQYGGRFEWRYNSVTDSLDLVVIEE